MHMDKQYLPPLNLTLSGAMWVVWILDLKSSLKSTSVKAARYGDTHFFYTIPFCLQYQMYILAVALSVILHLYPCFLSMDKSEGWKLETFHP